MARSKSNLPVMNVFAGWLMTWGAGMYLGNRDWLVASGLGVAGLIFTIVGVATLRKMSESESSAGGASDSRD